MKRLHYIILVCLILANCTVFAPEPTATPTPTKICNPDSTDENKDVNPEVKSQSDSLVLSIIPEAILINFITVCIAFLAFVIAISTFYMENLKNFRVILYQSNSFFIFIDSKNNNILNFIIHCTFQNIGVKPGNISYVILELLDEKSLYPFVPHSIYDSSHAQNETIPKNEPKPDFSSLWLPRLGTLDKFIWFRADTDHMKKDEINDDTTYKLKIFHSEKTKRHVFRDKWRKSPTTISFTLSSTDITKIKNGKVAEISSKQLLDIRNNRIKKIAKKIHIYATMMKIRNYNKKPNKKEV